MRWKIHSLEMTDQKEVLPYFYYFILMDALLKAFLRYFSNLNFATSRAVRGKVTVVPSLDRNLWRERFVQTCKLAYVQGVLHYLPYQFLHVRHSFNCWLNDFLCINKIVKYKTRIFNNCISRIIDYLTSLLERTASDGWQGSLVACRGCRTWSTVVASCTARTSINAVRKLTYCRGVP